MVHNDLRDWIDDLEERNDLKRITAEVNWDEEIGAITRRYQASLGRRCYLRISKSIATLSAADCSPTARGLESGCVACSVFQRKPLTASWYRSLRIASQNRLNPSSCAAVPLKRISSRATRWICSNSRSQSGIPTTVAVLS